MKNPIVKILQKYFNNEIPVDHIWSIYTDIHTAKAIDNIKKDPLFYKEIFNNLYNDIEKYHGSSFKNAWRREDKKWRDGLWDILAHYIFLVCGKDPIVRREIAGETCEELWMDSRHAIIISVMEERSLLNSKGLETALLILESLSGVAKKDRIRKTILDLLEVSDYVIDFEPHQVKPTSEEFVDELIKVYNELS